MSVTFVSMNNDKRATHPEHEAVARLDEGLSEACTPEEGLNTVGIGLFQVKLIILSGFVWMARGFEMVVVESIPSLLSCSLALPRWQGALMTMITTLATVLGCLLYGIWSDKYGRRTALSSSLIFLFVFNAVSAGLPSYPWFIIFRAVAGFAVGGLPQSLVLCCEYMPSRQRGRTVYILSCFWAIGTLLMLVLLFYALQTSGQWRLFIAIGTFPAFIAMIMMRFFPESFRYLLVSGHYIAANEILLEAAETNKKDLAKHLSPISKKKLRGRFVELFSKLYARSTVFLWFMGVATSICYYGLNAITPVLLTSGKMSLWEPSQVPTMNFLGSQKDVIPCKTTTGTDDFVFTIWTTALDFPGFVIFMILVDLIDRKKLLGASFLLSSLCIFLLLVPSLNIYFYICFTYVSRIILLSQNELLLLTAAEIYPTTHRGAAVGLEAAAFYLGCFLCSYAVQGLMSLGILYPIVAYGTTSFLAAVASFYLNIETRCRELRDSPDQG